MFTNVVFTHSYTWQKICLWLLHNGGIPILRHGVKQRPGAFGQSLCYNNCPVNFSLPSITSIPTVWSISHFFGQPNFFWVCQIFFLYTKHYFGRPNRYSTVQYRYWYSKALRWRFFGEWKKSCSSNLCNFCYLIEWRQDDQKTMLLKVFTTLRCQLNK